MLFGLVLRLVLVVLFVIDTIFNVPRRLFYVFYSPNTVCSLLEVARD